MVLTCTGHFRWMCVCLVRTFVQSRGHNVANTDPLGITFADVDNTIPSELELSSYNLGTVCLRMRQPAGSAPYCLIYSCCCLLVVATACE